MKACLVLNPKTAMAGAFQVVAPVLEGLDDGEKFLVVDVVVAFCWCHSAGMEGDRVYVVVGRLEL